MNMNFYIAAGGILFAVIIGAAIHFQNRRVRKKRQDRLEKSQTRIDRAKIKEALEAGRTQDRLDAEDAATRQTGIEARLLPKFEANEYTWLFEEDNLRDYYDGDVLADNGWFKEHAVAESPLEDTWVRTRAYRKHVEGITK